MTGQKGLGVRWWAAWLSSIERTTSLAADRAVAVRLHDRVRSEFG